MYFCEDVNLEQQMVWYVYKPEAAITTSNDTKNSAEIRVSQNAKVVCSILPKPVTRRAEQTQVQLQFLSECSIQF